MHFHPFPNKPLFLHVWGISLLKTLWEKEKLLVKSNFSFSHSVFYPFGEFFAIFIQFKNCHLQILSICRLGKGLMHFISAFCLMTTTATILTKLSWNSWQHTDKMKIETKLKVKMKNSERKPNTYLCINVDKGTMCQVTVTTFLQNSLTQNPLISTQKKIPWLFLIALSAILKTAIIHHLPVYISLLYFPLSYIDCQHRSLMTVFVAIETIPAVFPAFYHNSGRFFFSKITSKNAWTLIYELPKIVENYCRVCMSEDSRVTLNQQSWVFDDAEKECFWKHYDGRIKCWYHDFLLFPQ